MLSAPVLESLAVERLAGFPTFLRANGFAVGGADGVQVLRSAERVGVLNAPVLRYSLQALLCGRVDEWRRFNELFDAWFGPPDRWQRVERRNVDRADAGVQPDGRADNERTSSGNEAARARHAASRDALTGSTDLRALTAREHLLDIEALMRRFARQLRPIRLRRQQSARAGRRLDLPGTIRRSVSRGGTPIELRWRQRRQVQPRLVLLIDVSRSMAAYSFFYLRLARALGAERHDVHSFIFHTGLTPVSRALQEPDPWRAQEQLQFIAQGFGGGTRIGESLAAFNREHAPRLVHARTAVIVLSDGYDTGAPQQLADALAQLKRRARRIVWLNPLLQHAGYAPLSQGMQAALPHIDLLAPAGDLNSLKAALPHVLAALH